VTPELLVPLLAYRMVFIGRQDPTSHRILQQSINLVVEDPGKLSLAQIAGVCLSLSS
jgi:hypothetical protein